MMSQKTVAFHCKTNIQRLPLWEPMTNQIARPLKFVLIPKTELFIALAASFTISQCFAEFRRQKSHHPPNPSYRYETPLLLTVRAPHTGSAVSSSKKTQTVRKSLFDCYLGTRGYAWSGPVVNVKICFVCFILYLWENFETFWASYFPTFLQKQCWYTPLVG